MHDARMIHQHRHDDGERDARRTAAALVAGVAVAGAVLAAAGERRWRTATRRKVGRLHREEEFAAREPGPPFTRAALGALPAPVARYLTLALPEGQRRIRRGRIAWEGLIRTRPAAGWSVFTARQHFTTRPPGFVWDARVWMPPPLAVRVRDAYVEGEGSTRGAVAGLVPVMSAAGSDEIAESALVRWLGEAVWFPTALLPGGPVEWAEVDERSARATVTDGGTRAVAEFDFASTGEVVRMTARRYRDVGGRAVRTRFEGRYQGWTRRHGVLVPSSAVVAWILREGRFTYWRGHAVDVAYELE